jgi:hypothetical protein
VLVDSYHVIKESKRKGQLVDVDLKKCFTTYPEEAILTQGLPALESKVFCFFKSGTSSNESIDSPDSRAFLLITENPLYPVGFDA